MPSDLESSSSVRFCRSLACPPRKACSSCRRIQALLEHHGVVLVGTEDEDPQRDTSDIYDDMSFGTELAADSGCIDRLCRSRLTSLLVVTDWVQAVSGLSPNSRLDEAAPQT